MKEWRLIHIEKHNAFKNMAIDEAIMTACREGKVPPTLRFYTWDPPGLSLGYFQKYDKEVNEAMCKKFGVDIVRRPTGGRAVLHDAELTYSFVIPEVNDYLDKTIMGSYKKISEALIRGLKHTGIDANNVHKAEQGKSLSAACFDAPSWYEIVVEGKKLVGSAQTRNEGMLLQHGSIVIDWNLDMFIELLRLKSEKTKNFLKENLMKKSTTIKNILNKDIDINLLADNIKRGFEEEFEISLKVENITDYERKIAEQLTEKYESDTWNKKR
ncbi:lipoate--protein ligase family protein [Aceticella autotrophica]|uniref:Lipoate--protein ligase family protein n=1 Tax=Aceticella autotrophica TaxID=2755338 RepID=A0A975AVL5_9THEO|nr:biotin/lipoate A/B protein ligase family protein [Aceticella autotrophica]QSZ27271.1 lipoate--protein ligase family protein [Aceticella autotrophica]